MHNSSHKIKIRFITAVLFLSATAAIFYYSWLPSSNLKTETYLPQVIINWANTYVNLRTAIPFLVLGALCEVWQTSSINYNEKKYFFVTLQTILISTVIVCLAEAGQFFISDRHPDLMDVFFGISGGICGGIITRLIHEVKSLFFL